MLACPKRFELLTSGFVINPTGLTSPADNLNGPPSLSPPFGSGPLGTAGGRPS